MSCLNEVEAEEEFRFDLDMVDKIRDDAGFNVTLASTDHVTAVLAVMSLFDVIKDYL